MYQAGQDDVVGFLEQGLGRDCRRIDTHAASIFLAGERAWKMKRAVRYPYLDFSTIERRRAALEAEFRLNRRTAPDLYLGVFPIVRNGSGLHIGGSGEPIDWVLEMRRFPDDARLDRHIDAHGTDIDLMMRLADTIHAFHAGQEPASGLHGAADMDRVIDGNSAALDEHDTVFGAERIARLIEAQRSACARHADLLDVRGRKGKVRRVHGDLHLANIAVIDGEPVPFDCLEFSDQLATIDILYDLAFLLMDLWHRGHRNAANVVFNRYIDLSADEDGVRLLPLFLSIRATVRAHVMATTAARSHAPADRSEANRFFELAEQLMQRRATVAIAIGGLSGTGKTAVARAIGADFGGAPGARILRSDVLRKRIAGVAPEQRLPAALYSPIASRTVYELLAECAARHLSHHHAVIADAVFAGEEERAALVRAAAHGHVPFVGCWLEAPIERRLTRVGDRHRDASDADISVVRLQDSRSLQAPQGWCRISAGGTLEQTVADARAGIESILTRSGVP